MSKFYCKEHRVSYTHYGEQYSRRDGCPECREDELQKDKRAAGRRVENEAKEIAEGIPQLTGSNRQVDWASDIRGYQLGQTNNPLGDLTVEEYNAARNALLAHTDAKWWIENRAELKKCNMPAVIAKKTKLEVALQAQINLGVKGVWVNGG